MTRVAISDSIPPDGNSWPSTRSGYSEIFADGRQAAANGTGGKVIYRTITPDYFRVLGIPIVAGHDFTEEDRTTASNPMIVSQMLAARLFPGQDPVGKHIQFGTFQSVFALDKQVFTVIGVAANAKIADLQKRMCRNITTALVISDRTGARTPLAFSDRTSRFDDCAVGARSNRANRSQCACRDWTPLSNDCQKACGSTAV